MSYLLDTNILSEIAKLEPDERVIRWLQTYNSLYLSVITIGELQRGISRLPRSRKKSVLASWLDEQLTLFSSSILPLDSETVLVWGEMIATLEKQGRPMPILDSLIAATAIRHNLTLVTRNTRDFAHLDLVLVNPFES